MSVLTAKGELWVRTGETCYPYAGPRVRRATGSHPATRSRGRGSSRRWPRRWRRARQGSRRSPAVRARGRPRGRRPGERRDGRVAARAVGGALRRRRPSPMAVTDLRVDYDPSAVEQLRRLYAHVQPLDWYFPVMWDRPVGPARRGGRARRLRRRARSTESQRARLRRSEGRGVVAGEVVPAAGRPAEQPLDVSVVSAPPPAP